MTDGFEEIKENTKKMNACLALSVHSWSTSKFVITWASANRFQEDLERWLKQRHKIINNDLIRLGRYL